MLWANISACTDFVTYDGEGFPEPISITAALEVYAESKHVYAYLRVRTFGWPIPCAEARTYVFASGTQWREYDSNGPAYWQPYLVDKQKVTLNIACCIFLMAVGGLCWECVLARLYPIESPTRL